MTKHDDSDDNALPTDLARWVADHAGPVRDSRLLSTSNSRVWWVRTDTGEFISKALTDASSTPDVEHIVMRRIPERTRFAGVSAVSRRSDGRVFVLAPFRDGPTLASAIGTAGDDMARLWFEDFTRIAATIATVPVTGFGKVSPDLTGPYDTWPGFLRAYLREQAGKAPRLAELRHSAVAELVEHAADHLAEVVTTPTLVSADVNNNNFVVTERGLVCVNTPVLWAGDPASPFGEAAVHWAGTRAEQALYDASPVPLWRLHFYAAFHGYAVLAYVERFSPQPLDEAPAWGTTTPILQTLDQHLRRFHDAFPAAEQVARRCR
jgi:hypothetical protein